MQTVMAQNELTQLGMRWVLGAIKQVKQEMPSHPLQRICPRSPEPCAFANALQGQVAFSQ